MKNKKAYEAPKMNVTAIAAENVIMASALISLDEANIIGKGKVNWIDIN